MLLFLKDQYTGALKLLRAASAEKPLDASIKEKLALVLSAAGLKSEAAQALERSIQIDPSRETPYHLLADLQPTPEKRKRVLERYLQFNPQSLIAREALTKALRP
jgi:predicted Zn-dependent protease